MCTFATAITVGVKVRHVETNVMHHKLHYDTKMAVVMVSRMHVWTLRSNSRYYVTFCCSSHVVIGEEFIVALWETPNLSDFGFMRQREQGHRSIDMKWISRQPPIPCTHRTDHNFQFFSSLFH